MQRRVDTAGSRPLREQSGLALIATLFVLTLIASITVVFFSTAVTDLRVAATDYQAARTFYAAEAGVEGAIAQIAERLQDGVLTPAELASIQPPPLEGFDFSGFEVSQLGDARVETIANGPYTGLYALTTEVLIHSQAEDATGVMSAIELTAKAQAIPLFQFGIFYETDLEATNGPPMDFIGRVHSNGNIYLSSANAYYHEQITTPEKMLHRRKDANASLDGVYIDDSEGNGVQLLFDSETVADGEAFKQRSCDDFDCRIQTEAFGVDPLRLPFPDGVTAYELMRPRADTDGAGTKNVKFAWIADTRVIVDLTDPRPRPQVCGSGGGGGERVPQITILRDGRPVPDASTTCDIFDWDFSAFYDGREEEMKDVLNIDIDELDDWVDEDPLREMRLIYVRFVLPPGGLGDYNQSIRNQIFDGTLDPALRMRDAAELPNPLTVASEWPIYVDGDYNSEEKQPAALVGDGITILSEGWSDGSNRPGGNCTSVSQGVPCSIFNNYNWNMDNAATTTVNAALLAGHWATPCDWVESGCPTPASNQNWYGGGIENFPRFLEDWSGVPYNYLGALVSPFTSEKTTGTWNGSYYSPPNRNWLFDTDFQDPNKLPPGTPNVGSVLRASFREAA